ncbi:MAG: nuclear transport factor 2 family protein [Patescibacteria group bacterium]|nr:nuclear transport factor 2 family protein [Patescibacteria group bacterium]
MPSALEIAKRYFDLSNESNFEGIQDLFTESTTYSSATTGVYLGRTDIMEMQRKFHAQFESVQWKVNSVEEIKPGIVLFDFEFNGKKRSGQTVKTVGVEYVIVYKGKIQHIEIRNSDGRPR